MNIAKNINFNYLDEFIVNNDAWQEFLKLGFPNKRIEEYKYFDVKFLKDFNLIPAKINHYVEIDDVYKHLIKEDNLLNLIFVNGVYYQTLSNQNNFVIQDNDIIHDNGKLSLTQYNLAFVKNKYTLNLDESNQKIIIINHFNYNTEEQQTSFTNLKINVKDNANIKICERFINLNENNLFNNYYADFNLSENSKICHYIIAESQNNYNNISYNINQNKASSYQSFVFNSKSKISRIDHIVNLSDINAISKIKAIYFADSGELMDHYILTKHNSGNSFSDHEVKGIIKAKGTGVFYASTYVPRESQKIEAHQLNKNLLLAKGAQCYSRPELKIYADDVKCSHGSATGQLDDEALFYMQSRGLNEDLAKKLILEGFISEILFEIEDEVIVNYLKEKFIIE